MGHYIANLRDIEFCLFDLLDRESILGKGIYADVDRATAMGMLEEVKRLCENDLAASFIEGDRKGTDFNKATGDVKLPESFKKSYRAYVDGGWGMVDAPAALGGTEIPPSVRWAIAERFLVQTLRFTFMHQVLPSHRSHMYLVMKSKRRLQNTWLKKSGAQP